MARHGSATWGRAVLLAGGLLGLLVGTPGCGGEGSAEGHTPREVVFGDVQDEGQVAIEAVAGGSLSVGGATLTVAPGALGSDAMLKLVHASLPTPPLAGAGTDIYYLASDDRPVRQGQITLSLPLTAAPPGLAAADVRVFALLQGEHVVAVDATLDEAAGQLLVSRPDATMLRTPADPLRTLDAHEPLGAPAPTGPVAPEVGLFLAGAPPGGASSSQCQAGAPGEIHESPGHRFRVIINQQTTCDFARFVSDALDEALTLYNTDYPLASGAAPFAELTDTNRMNVYLADFQKGVNGEYKFVSWTGYILVSVTAGEGDQSGLRETLFHEMFHAVQDRFANLFIGGIAAMWWFEATAEWAGLRARGLDLAGAVATGLETYPEVFAVPIQDSRSFRGGLLSYGQSLLIYPAEQRTPGYVHETLKGWSVRSGTLYAGLVEAAQLATGYMGFMGQVMGARLETSAFWTDVRLFESDTETRIYTRSPGPLGEATEAAPQRLRDDKQRYKARTFSLNLGPLTTRFIQVQAPATLAEGRSVQFIVTRDGQPTDQALLGVRRSAPSAGVSINQVSVALTGTPSSPSASVGALGTGVTDLFLGLVNADPDKSARYKVTIELSRASLRDPFARCKSGEYDAAFDLFKEGVDIGFSRGSTDANLMVANCSFGYGDYAEAETRGLAAASSGGAGASAQGYFTAEYAVERMGGDGTAYREAGIEKAKKSGQCSGAADDEAAEGCAGFYRAGIRSSLESWERNLAEPDPAP